MRVACCVLWMLVAIEAAAAPAPLPKREMPPAERIVEIDFSPMDTLALGDYEWELRAEVRYPDGFSMSFRADERNGPVSAEIAARKLRLDVERCFRAVVAPCGKKVVLRGNGFGWVELTLTGLPASAKPTMRWLR